MLDFPSSLCDAGDLVLHYYGHILDRLTGDSLAGGYSVYVCHQFVMELPKLE